MALLSRRFELRDAQVIVQPNTLLRWHRRRFKAMWRNRSQREDHQSHLVMVHNPIWLGILLAINLQTSFLTPPFGFSLFYLRGAAPAAVTTGHIYAGVAPFIGLQVVAIVIIWLMPGISTWLPDSLF